MDSMNENPLTGQNDGVLEIMDLIIRAFHIRVCYSFLHHIEILHVISKQILILS